MLHDSGCSAVFMTERPLLQKVGLQVVKLWTQMQMKHEVFSLVNVSSLDGCEIWWISQDEGSEIQSKSLICSCVSVYEEARMTYYFCDIVAF